MSYIIIKPSMSKELKLRLTTQSVITLQDTFNKDIVTIIEELASGHASLEVTHQIIKESLRPFYNINSDNDMYTLIDGLIREDGYTITDFYGIINRVFEHAGFFNNGSEEDDSYDNENNTYPEEGVNPEPTDKCFIYCLRDRAIECGMDEDKFWRSTVGEVKRYIDSYNKKYVENFKQELMLAHLNADLMYLSIGRLFDKDAKYPELMDIYPELFKQELEQREIQREQEAIAKRQADVRENLFNILQHTLVHNKKEESKNEEGSEINNGEEQRGSADTGQS